MFHLESVHCKVLCLKDQAGFNIQKPDWHGRLRSAQHHAVDEVVHAFHRVSAAVNVYFLDGFPPHEGGNETRKTQDMIQMPVREQNVVQAFKPNPGFEDLALGTLTTVNHEAVLAVFDNQRRKPSFNGGRGSGGAEKNKFKQG